MALIAKLLVVGFLDFIFSSNFIFCADEQCIEGSYHLKTPSAEGAEYEFCTPWKNLTCCNTTLDKQVAAGDSPDKYNDTWHKCGNLSQECLKFWQQQECFYQCSPYTYKWKSNTAKDAIEGVPICADQCDDWYKACKSDEICVENVLENLEEAKNFGEKCPKDKVCKTYSDMYGSGQKLCETLWGSSYKYTKQNPQKDNCMVFWFTPGNKNPNMNVKKITSFASHNAMLPAMFLLPVLTATLHILF